MPINIKDVRVGDTVLFCVGDKSRPVQVTAVYRDWDGAPNKIGIRLRIRRIC